MKEFRLFIALLSIILLACMSGVEGQYAQYPLSSGYPATLNPPTIQTAQVGQTTDVSQYSQYYTMGPAQSTHITAPQDMIAGSPPATLYVGTEQQPMTYSQYESNPAYVGVNSLWIVGNRGSWTQYAKVPQGAIVPLGALSPSGGEGFISEINPSGRVDKYEFYFSPRSLLQFYADTPGRHVLTFVLAGREATQVSHQVTIDVTPRYYTQPSYYSGYPYNWYGYNYPWYWGDYWGDYPWYGYWNYYPDWDDHHERDHHKGDKDHHEGPPPHDGDDHKPPLPPPPHDGDDGKNHKHGDEGKNWDMNFASLGSDRFAPPGDNLPPEPDYFAPPGDNFAPPGDNFEPQGSGIPSVQGQGLGHVQGLGLGQGQGPDFGQGQGHGLGLGHGQGPDFGQGLGPDFGQGQGLGHEQGLGLGQGQGLGHEQGLGLGQGQGPDFGQGQGHGHGHG